MIPEAQQFAATGWEWLPITREYGIGSGRVKLRYQPDTNRLVFLIGGAAEYFMDADDDWHAIRIGMELRLSHVSGEGES